MKKLFIILLLATCAFCTASDVQVWIDKAEFSLIDENGTPFDHPADTTIAYLGSPVKPLIIGAESSHPWKVADIQASIKTSGRAAFVDYDISPDVQAHFDITKKVNLYSVDIVTIQFLLTDKDLNTDEGAGLMPLVKLEFETDSGTVFIKVKIWQENE